jgi:branched-chain amino acid transport system substrate-binding protein
MAATRNRLWRLLAAALAGSLVMAACGDDDDDEAATAPGGGQTRSVTIAFVGAKTGDNANLGLNIRDGVKLAVDEANREGRGPTIEAKEFDTAGDPAQASTIRDQFLADESIIAMVGPAFSGETKALLPAIQDAGMPMISASATNVELPNVVPNSSVFHRVIGDDALQGEGIARYLVEFEKPRSVAYIHDNSEYGKGLTEGLERAARSRGLRTALVDTVDPKAQDFSATVNKVNASGADLVFYGGYYAEAGRFKKQLTDARSRAKFLSGDGSLDPGFITAAGAAAANGSIITCPCNLALETSSGELKQFYDSFRASANREPGLYSPEGYDAAKILIDAIKAGHDTRRELVDFLENEFSRYDGVSKEIEFEPNGNLVRREFFVFQVKDGKIAPHQTIRFEGSERTTTTTTAAGATTTTTR